MIELKLYELKCNFRAWCTLSRSNVSSPIFCDIQKYCHNTHKTEEWRVPLFGTNTKHKDPICPVWQIPILSLEDRWDPNQSPSHHLLSQILKSWSGQPFHKHVTQLLGSLNLEQPNFSLLNLLSKPNCLDCVVPASRCELRRNGFCEDQCSSIILMNGNGHWD
jgi:hypothetical protein